MGGYFENRECRLFFIISKYQANELSLFGIRGFFVKFEVNGT